MHKNAVHAGAYVAYYVCLISVLYPAVGGILLNAFGDGLILCMHASFRKSLGLLYKRLIANKLFFYYI